MSASPHLSAHDAASYIDGTLSDAARAEIERHLAECDDCRAEVAASARLVASAPAPSPRRGVPWRLVLPLAAGILAVVMIRRPTTQIEDTPMERGGAGEGSAIALVAPVGGTPLVAGRTRLIWHPLDGSIGYRVVIKDASGAEVWRGDAMDTVLAVPAGVPLRAGEQYVWRVDGQRSDGSSTSSAEASVRASQ